MKDIATAILAVGFVGVGAWANHVGLVGGGWLIFIGVANGLFGWSGND